MNARTDLRLALPSKGRLESDSTDFLRACGLPIYKPNPRQYQATLPAIPSLSVLYQRPADIVVGVRQGSLDFGIAGLDQVEENRGADHEVIILHEALGFGFCSLMLAVPESWDDVQSVSDLAKRAQSMSQPLRVATKYPVLTERFLQNKNLKSVELVSAEGTLEVAPAIGYADMISDLVSSGMTLHDNRLRALTDGTILRSQACLIANRQALQKRPEALAVARELLEFFEAHLRAQAHCLVLANMRGTSPESIAQLLFSRARLGGLQGPTISRVITGKQSGDTEWYDVSIVVRKDQVMQSVKELRAMGGSGVVVTPVIYIFEEEPERYVKLQKTLESVSKNS